MQKLVMGLSAYSSQSRNSIPLPVIGLSLEYGERVDSETHREVSLVGSYWGRFLHSETRTYLDFPFSGRQILNNFHQETYNCDNSYRKWDEGLKHGGLIWLV